MANYSSTGDVDTMRDADEPRSAQIVWEAICKAKEEFEPYLRYCDIVDRLVSASGELMLQRGYFFNDQEFDLLWSSLEILKPAVYCKPPQAVVAPRFNDRNKVASVASELLERCLNSTFERTDFDQTMLEVRDDLIIAARGAIRTTYESKNGKQVCNDHVDRNDFLHEPARKWSEVGWVAFAAYLDKNAFKKRFPKADPEQAQYSVQRDPNDHHRVDTVAKCKVWEVWHKADNRVYWVTEGIENFLDEQKPFLDLEGFFPCPRPAYGTKKRRTLIPVPDYVRYERHLEQINTLTFRIYNLLTWIKVKGLIPAGGEVAQAVETALANVEDDVLLIPVPGAALMSAGSGTAGFVQFLPIAEFASTITSLLDARRELINNFYELSGISDIMRGATEAEETYGAQQLKSQYGSVRVREKIDELQRIARDSARVSAEIIAEKFDAETMLAMAQMEIPTKAELKGKVKELEAAAKKEMDALEQQAMQMAEQAKSSGEEINPQQAEQQFNQAQQQIIGKYQGMLDQVAKQVPIEDVMDFLRDQKARAFAIDIETDSTIMTDELAEKQARGEFLQAFSQASTMVQPLLMAGESGAKLAGGMLKFALAPFRAGRELDGMIDDFVEEAPTALAGQGGDGGAEQAIAEANKKLAEAEMTKAQAAVAGVQAKAQLDQAETQRKMAELQNKASNESSKLQLQLADMQEKAVNTAKLTEAQINKLTADTAKILASIGLDQRKQELSEYQAANAAQAQQVDQAMAAEGMQREAVEGDRNAQLSERQQAHAEEQSGFDNQRAERSEDRADRSQDFSERQGERQQTLAERQAQREGAK